VRGLSDYLRVFRRLGSIAPLADAVKSLCGRPLRHLSWKIIVPYALLTVLLGAVGTYMVTTLVAGSLQERFDNQLAEAGRVAADSVVRKERNHLEGVRAVAFTEDVGQAVAAGDTQSLTRLLEPLMTNLGLERAEIVDRGGNRLLGLTREGPDADLTFRPVDAADTSQWPPVQRVLEAGEDEQGDKFAGLVETPEGLTFFTAGPIRSGTEIVGVVLVGTYLDSLARQAREEALAEVTFYDFKGRPLTSTFAGGGSASEEVNLGIGSSTVDSILGKHGETTRESRSVWKRGYDLVYGPLIIRNQVVGLYSVALPTQFIFQAGSATRWQMSAVFAVAMLLVLLTGYLLAHAITGRVGRLVRAARKVASGNLSARSSVAGEDEIAVLAKAFDDMTASLRSRTHQLREHHFNTIKTLTAVVDARDPYTAGHSMRVGELARLMGKRLGLRGGTLDALRVGGYLHDVGKIGIRDAILLKPTGLSDVERLVVDGHTMLGVRILGELNLMPEVLDFVLCHHERLDGSGYPQGLRGGKLSLVARIAAVCDVYDALTTDRPYRPALAPREAAALLRARAGTLFDRTVVMALEEIYVGWEAQRRSDPLLKGIRLPPTMVDSSRQEAA
jgi:putative nucleotidyltransferase with HDIG domain